YVVANIAEQRLHLGVHGLHLRVLQASADLSKGRCCIAQLKQFSAKRVEALYLIGRERCSEDSVLHGFDLTVHGLQHRHVVVDDEIKYGIEDIVLAVRQGRRAGLASLPYRAVGCGCPVSHRDYITATHKQVGLAESNPPLNHLRSTRDNEERVPVLLNLWVLMCLSRILNCQVVQSELCLDARQQIIARFEQADPDNMTGFLRPFASFLDGDVGNTFAARVHASSNNPWLW